MQSSLTKLNRGGKGRPKAKGRIWIVPPSWKPPAPSPCEARAGRGLGRGARSIESDNWNPLSLTLSPLLRRGERGASRRTNVLSEHVIGNGYAKSTSSPDSVRAGSEGGG